MIDNSIEQDCLLIRPTTREIARMLRLVIRVVTSGHVTIKDGRYTIRSP